MINGHDILAAAAACHSFLEPAVGADWTAAVPGLDFSVTSVVAHAANGPLWYALDLWGGPGMTLPSTSRSGPMRPMPRSW
jgi:hypothetical protein